MSYLFGFRNRVERPIRELRELRRAQVLFAAHLRRADDLADVAHIEARRGPRFLISRRYGIM